MTENLLEMLSARLGNVEAESPFRVTKEGEYTLELIDWEPIYHNPEEENDKDYPYHDDQLTIAVHWNVEESVLRHIEYFPSKGYYRDLGFDWSEEFTPSAKWLKKNNLTKAQFNKLSEEDRKRMVFVKPEGYDHIHHVETKARVPHPKHTANCMNRIKRFAGVISPGETKVDVIKRLQILKDAAEKGEPLAVVVNIKKVDKGPEREPIMQINKWKSLA